MIPVELSPSYDTIPFLRCRSDVAKSGLKARFYETLRCRTDVAGGR